MAFTIQPLQALFVAQAKGIELRQVHDRATLDALRDAMDRYAVLVFRDQPFQDSEQLEFAQRFDGQLHSKTGAAVLSKSRLGNEALTDISNLDENGEVLASQDRRRMYSLGNRLWHTDASFQDPAGRYSRGASGYRVRGHACRLRCAGRRDESEDCKLASPPLHRLLENYAGI